MSMGAWAKIRWWVLVRRRHLYCMCRYTLTVGSSQMGDERLLGTQWEGGWVLTRRWALTRDTRYVHVQYTCNYGSECKLHVGTSAAAMNSKIAHWEKSIGHYVMWFQLPNIFRISQPSLFELARREDFAQFPIIPPDFIRKHGATYAGGSVCVDSFPDQPSG